MCLEVERKQCDVLDGRWWIQQDRSGGSSLRFFFFARRAGRKVRGKAKPGGNGGRTRKGREGRGGRRMRRNFGGEDGDDYEGGREGGKRECKWEQRPGEEERKRGVPPRN
jgi:hypothetical protein